MAPSVGISTYLADSWGNTLNGVGFVVPATYFQLHTGIPGGAGTTDVSQTTLRVPATFAPSVNGAFDFTGMPPIWAAAVAAETIPYISGWSGGLDDDNAQFLFSAKVLVAKTVAVGDQIAIGTFTFNFLQLASS
ncbi:phage tail fiber protein [Mycobacterium malmoense]|uniref:phage tail fiber protein n=1 Tax=Mycobacterium malmoense TaxID=1780 RepID=UPI0008F94D54|nr:hypothetical protein [Mycobacterium malmoense]OIN79773.1 hypothetical protein BMG05_16640 [Mycobacterium malmoense]